MRFGLTWLALGLLSPAALAQEKAVAGSAIPAPLIESARGRPTPLSAEPDPGLSFILTYDGQTGQTVVAVPTGVAPGRYLVHTPRGDMTIDVAPPPPVPATNMPAVILMNGWQIDTLQGACPVRPSTGTFGEMQQRFEAQGRAVLFFDNCRECAGGTIEDCARAFKMFLDAQRTVTGDAVEQFDLVGHSMGGLIARSYLAGKFPEGWFPPEPHRIRKLAMLAVPNFGAYNLLVVDKQTAQMKEGSFYLWQLATWNQGEDDVRGVDAIAIAGKGAGSRGDGVVSLASASISFVHDPKRTRVIDYCHTTGFPLTLICGPKPAIAQVAGQDHLGWRAVESFLNDRLDWLGIGQAADEDPWLSTHGGILGVLQSAEDFPLSINPIQTPDSPAGPVELKFSTWEGERSFTVTNRPYGIRPQMLKYGPIIGRVLSDKMVGLTIASGGQIQVYGDRLEGAEILANTEPLEIVSREPSLIRAVLPDKFTGLVWLTARTVQGSHTFRIMTRRPEP